MLNCKLGVKKVFRLTYEEQKPIKAIFDQDGGSKIVTRPRLLLDALKHFQSNAEEITMSVSSEHLELCSYVDENKSLSLSLDS